MLKGNAAPDQTKFSAKTRLHFFLTPAPHPMTCPYRRLLQRAALEVLASFSHLCALTKKDVLSSCQPSNRRDGKTSAIPILGKLPYFHS